MPVALSRGDYIELLPATWRAINAYGVKINHRIYDAEELNPFRRQPSGVAASKDLWEIHYDPYDVSRIWVRNHRDGGWITVPWTHLHGAPVPFGELAWDHARSPGRPRREPGHETEIAGPSHPAAPGRPGPEAGRPGRARREDRRVAARTRATTHRPPGRRGPPQATSRRRGPLPASDEPAARTSSRR